MGKYCFGVDVGGTTVKLGLFNTNGDLMEKWEIPTVTDDDGCRENEQQYQRRQRSGKTNV